METVAEGLATSVPFATTTRLLRERLDDFLLVDDGELLEGVRRLLEEGVLMEVASATGVAAALRRREELAGKTVVLPVSGRNLSMGKLRAILDWEG
jgi:threonine dehydratase